MSFQADPEIVNPYPIELVDTTAAIVDVALGKYAVWAENGRVHQVLRADQRIEHELIADAILQKHIPEGGRIQQLSAVLTGKARTKRENAWLSQYELGHFGTYEPVGDDHYAEQLRLRLNDARQILLGFDEEQSRQFDYYLNNSVSGFIAELGTRLGQRDSLNGEEAAYRSWALRLGVEADDAELTNFLQWHIHVLNEQLPKNNQEVAGEVQRMKSHYKKGVKRGVTEGWLSPDATAAIDGIDTVDVRVGDTLDTHMRSIGGYHIRGTRYVVIPQGMGETKEVRTEHLRINLRSALFHELDHAELGEYDGAPWLDEALTEHLAKRILDASLARSIRGMMNVKLEELGAYVDCRRLLSVVLNEGSEKISLDLATRAYSSRGARQREKKEFSEAIDESWGTPNTLRDISAAWTGLVKHYMSEGFHQTKAYELAASEVSSMLLQQPHVIFGKQYTSPGAAFKPM